MASTDVLMHDVGKNAKAQKVSVDGVYYLRTPLLTVVSPKTIVDAAVYCREQMSSSREKTG